MSGNSRTEEYSLYIHIPFCRQKCGYCHFYVLPDKEELKEQLLTALLLEWNRLWPWVGDRQLVSIYFGGGTPTLFGPQRIATLLHSLQNATAFANDVEITIEGNPEDITLEAMQEYRRVGINRASIGVQSLDKELLQTLTRQHSAEEAMHAVEASKQAGIDNISIDVMYDVPGQRLTAWQQTLERATALPITHLSLYNLTIEPHTSFHKKRAVLAPLLPSEELSAAMYPLAVQHLRKAGLEQYEVSAFARDGKISKHNSGYWLGRPFLGLGPSAFSYWGGKRFRNQAHQGSYAQALKEGRSPVDFEEQLDPDAAERERLVIAIRLCQGIDLNNYPLIQSEALKILHKLSEQELVIKNRTVWCLTDKGRLYYDSVAEELI